MDRARLRTFLLGSAAGLLAGVLFAPRSGRELRGSLADRAGEARERGRESYFETREGMLERRAAFRDGRDRTRDPAPAEPREEPAPDPPRLRDVSEGTGEPAGEAGGGAERSEELRRKVRETRERLRGRRDLGQGPEA